MHMSKILFDQVDGRIIFLELETTCEPFSSTWLKDLLYDRDNPPRLNLITTHTYTVKTDNEPDNLILTPNN